ncbi:uncharacterized protein L201_006489 [Kwoniella dendrophila CBS 6074]|uniref:Kinetochore protein Mis12/MTW1 n=1 Tax=Kwoniella dendrophila CBS 6074 TaxID=1295534 RepID=A0AAX4K464_9TREE
MAPTRTNTNKTPRKPNPIASSSKHTLTSIPPVDIPESITPGYTYQPAAERKGLDEDERARLIHELVGFHPRALCHDISEAARSEVYHATGSIEDWVRSKGDVNSKLETELNTGLVSLETLLESHVDKAFEKFTAWVLRNAFEFSPELEVVLPWQKGLDFQRGEYITKNLKNGQEEIENELNKLRLKVEQTRLLSSKLELAEKKITHKLNIAKQRKNEVGFIKELINSSDLNPLPKPTQQLIPILNSLNSSLKPLEPISTNILLDANINMNLNIDKQQITTNQHTKAWELGRSAYLNWALNKIVNPPSTTTTSNENSHSNSDGTKITLQQTNNVNNGSDKLSEIENSIKNVIEPGNKNSLEVSEKVLGNL